MHLLVLVEAARVPRLTSSGKPLSPSAAETGARRHFEKILSDEATQQTEDVEEGEGGNREGNYPCSQIKIQQSN